MKKRIILVLISFFVLMSAPVFASDGNSLITKWDKTDVSDSTKKILSLFSVIGKDLSINDKLKGKKRLYGYNTSLSAEDNSGDGVIDAVYINFEMMSSAEIVRPSLYLDLGFPDSSDESYDVWIDDNVEIVLCHTEGDVYILLLDRSTSGFDEDFIRENPYTLYEIGVEVISSNDIIVSEWNAVLANSSSIMRKDIVFPTDEDYMLIASLDENGSVASTEYYIEEGTGSITTRLTDEETVIRIKGAYVIHSLDECGILLEKPLLKHDGEKSEYTYTQNINFLENRSGLLIYKMTYRDGSTAYAKCSVIDGTGTFKKIFSEKEYHEGIDVSAFGFIPLSGDDLHIFINDYFEGSSSISGIALMRKANKGKDGRRILKTIADRSTLSKAIKTISSNDNVETCIQVTEFTLPDYSLSMKFSSEEEVVFPVLSFEDIAQAYKDDEEVSIAKDHSFLLYDTNPSNYKYLDEDSDKNEYNMSRIKTINKFLGIPEVIAQKMISTHDGAGMQTATYGDVTVTWSYATGRGLEVIYERVD